MARSQKLEEALITLKAIRNNLTSETATSTLRRVLQSKFSIAVAQAAKLVGDAELYDLRPELAKAFGRFMLEAAETDPGCKAKESIAENLYRLEFSDEVLFLQGIHHVQLEKTWGKSVDTAAGLRGICALGLVRMNYPNVMIELADLLADPDPSARANAARAIAYTENREGLALLRLKVHVGDTSPQVLSECFLGLLKLDSDLSLPFVVQFLDAASEETCEMAALALGESRLEAVFPILQDYWQRSQSESFRRVGLMAIAMLRHDAAIDFLLSLVASGRKSEAQEALTALKMYEGEPALQERVQAAIEQRSDDAFHLDTATK